MMGTLHNIHFVMNEITVIYTTFLAMIFFSDFTTTPDRKYFYGWFYLGLFALDTLLNMLIIASITFLEIKQACRLRSAKKKIIQDAKDQESKLERDILLGLDKKSLRRMKK